MKNSTFGRKRDTRNLLIRNLATSVILYESVVTTAAKGRAVQPVVDRLMSIALSDDKLTARRRLLGHLTDSKAVDKLINELAGRYTGQTSGFTRRYNLPARSGDGAPQVMIQLTKTVLLEEKSPEKNKKSTDNAEVKTEEAPAEMNNAEGENNG